MSLPPSALYPHSGVAYNELDSCYYSVAGTVLATPAINAVLTLDAGTGTNATGLFIQMGRDVGLKPNRKVPAGATDPVVGALVNTGSQPVQISGSVVILTTGAYVAGDIGVFRQGVGSATLVPVGGILVEAIDASVSIPFSCILLAGDSLFVKNGTVAQTASLSANLVACRASKVYGALNSIQSDYIPA
jgi:hypothetical protein